MSDVTKAGVPTASDVPDTDEVMEGAATSRDVLDGTAIEAPGDPDDPDSAAWEAVDAARARAAVATLTALRALLGDLAEREQMEVAAGTGDCDDAEAACDLIDAQSAIDYVLETVAPFAATEQAEADQRAADVGELAKSIVTLAKAGRVLSSSNEAAIRGAVESLQKVLDSLPAAKEADVTKADETVEPTVEDVAKADASTDDLSNLSDADLKRLAITGADGQRQAALAELGLRSISGEVAADSNDAADEAEDTADPADVDPNEASPEAEPAAEDMTKSTETDGTTPVDPIQKALADQKAEFDSVVKALQDRVNALEESPAPSRVLTNGAVPPAEQLRGQADSTPLAKATDDVLKRLNADQRQDVLYGALRDRYTA